MRQSGKLLNLLLITFGFVGALFVYNSGFNAGLGPYGMVAGTASSIVAFWMAAELRNDYSAGADGHRWWIQLAEQFSLGTGVNLVLHSVLTYTLNIRRTPLFIVLGGLFAAALLTIKDQLLLGSGARRSFLFAGFDSVIEKILPAIGDSAIGIVSEDQGACPPGLPYLGNFSGLREAVKTYRPTDIVVDVRHWSRGDLPSLFLEYRLAGIRIQGAPVLYEQIFGRVCTERLRPADLLLSTSLRGDSRIIAIQSVYTDLVAMSLLLALTPLMLLVALATKLAGGPGPVFEGMECAGFQYIPFRLLRFRTTRAEGPAEPTAVGALIRRLRLTNLPQLINVVRGDMALVGPKPVRLEFARYLSELMPFHSHRFSVKPGITGLAQMHVRSSDTTPEEFNLIEYDLHYVKEGSLWMDIAIMLQSLWPARSSRVQAAPRMSPQGADH